MNKSIALLLAACLSSSIPAQKPGGNAAPDRVAQADPELDAALRQLGSASSKERASARARLLARGRAIVPQLQRFVSEKNSDLAWLLQRAGRVAREMRRLSIKATARAALRTWRAAWRSNERLLLLDADEPRCFDVRLRPIDSDADDAPRLGRGVMNFAFGPHGRSHAVDRDSRVQLFLKGEAEALRLETQRRDSSLAYSPDGALLATSGYGREVKVWRVKDAEVVDTFNVTGTVGGLTPVFSPKGKVLAVGNRNAHSTLFSTESGQKLHELDRSSTHSLAFSPDGRRLAIAYVDGKVGIWSVQSGKLLKLLDGEAKEVFRVVWSPNGRLLASAGHRGNCVVYSGRYLCKLTSLDPETSRVFALSFSPDGKRLLCAGKTRSKIYEVAWR